MKMPKEVWDILMYFCRLEETVESKEICLKYLHDEINTDEFIKLAKEYFNKIDNKVEK